MSEYYNHAGYPAQGSSGSSSAMRAELDAIAAGFDKLPILAGNALKSVRVNGAGTGLEAVTAGSSSVSAGDVEFTPAGGVSALNVQAAITELDSEKQPLIGTISGMVKGNGANALTAAVAGTDYLAPSAIGSTVQAYDADTPTVAASQVEMEAGTEAALRSMSPLRVKQAIDALTGTKQIQPITASVGGSALTITLNPTTLDFRSATLTSGAVNTRTIGSAISLTVPSTATLGTINAVQNRLAVLAIDNAGTVELAVVNLAGGNDLSETGVITTTALSAAADSNNVIYSTTARTGVPYRVVGYVESTQATAGTWATAPSTIQGYGGQAFAAMSSLGYGQTWTDVRTTPGRSAGTTYYNTTGRPIQLSVCVNAGSFITGRITLTVNGVNVAQQGPNTGTAGGDSFANVTHIIPPGSSYSVTITTGSLSHWFELR